MASYQIVCQLQYGLCDNSKFENLDKTVLKGFALIDRPGAEPERRAFDFCLGWGRAEDAVTRILDHGELPAPLGLQFAHLVVEGDLVVNHAPQRPVHRFERKPFIDALIPALRDAVERAKRPLHAYVDWMWNDVSVTIRVERECLVAVTGEIPVVQIREPGVEYYHAYIKQIWWMQTTPEEIDCPVPHLKVTDGATVYQLR